jgi:hypothetical protein
VFFCSNIREGGTEVTKEAAKGKPRKAKGRNCCEKSSKAS